MKATGIVRRVDTLGRIVLPKELRIAFRIREGDPLEVFTDKDGSIVLKRYSPLGSQWELVEDVCHAISDSTGYIVAATDRDQIIAQAGPIDKDLTGLLNAPELNRLLRKWKEYRHTQDSERIPVANGIEGYYVGVESPILSQDGVEGCILLLSRDEHVIYTEADQRLIQPFADLLSRQVGV